MFEVGDKVKIKRFKEVDAEVIEGYFILSMFKYEEAETVVTGVDTAGDILLAIDNERDYWHPDMLVKIKETLKVGDKVKIRKDLVQGTTYGGVYVVRPMIEFLGKEATITDKDYDGDFLLDIDNAGYYWSAEMFEPKTDSKSISDDTMMDIDNILQEAVSESEVLRLSKAVIEYENIVHELESEVDYYETKYIDLVERYNVLVEKYNSVIDALKEECI